MNEKNISELNYWRKKRAEEGGHFKNACLIDGTPYEYFYTDFFGIDKKEFTNKKILDIGCGPRGSLDWLSEQSKCFGLDPLAEEYMKINPSIKMDLIKGNLETFDTDVRFDFVCTFNSLDHVDDLSRSIYNLHKLCSPNGTLLLIADIHEEPTKLEPSAFNWDISQTLSRIGFKILSEKHYEKHNTDGMYQSLLNPVAFDHNSLKKRYGIIAIKAKLA